MSVMVPPEGRGVAGAKERVTGTDALPFTRSDKAMSNNTFKTVVALSQASNSSKFESESFTLYTRIDRIAKSERSKYIPLLTAILTKVAHPFAEAFSIPFILKELLRSDPINQLPLEAESVADVAVIHPHEPWKATPTFK